MAIILDGNKGDDGVDGPAGPKPPTPSACPAGRVQPGSTTLEMAQTERGVRTPRAV